MTPLIDAQDIWYSYRQTEGRETPVLQGLSFQIFPGEFVAIQGPSGSGKSTLLYLLGCMNPIQRGSLKIGGVDVTKLTSNQAALFRNRFIGFIFQQFHLLPRATVVENISLPGQYPVELSADRSQVEARARELCAAFGLGERAEHHPHQLSGGQQQRVAIARALLNQAPLILADEPTGNLDSNNSQAVMDLLKKFQSEGKTVVIITHDRDIAAQADRRIILNDGVVISEDGQPPRKQRESSFARDFEEQKAQMSRSELNLKYFFQLWPFAWANLFRNRLRSLLTMLGVSIGIAAVLAMVTIGSFARERILAGYAELGVNTLQFFGHTNWDRKATDSYGLFFSDFSWDKDLQPLKQIFPNIRHISPVLRNWDSRIGYGGKSIDRDVRTVGINDEAFLITRQKILQGAPINEFHVKNRSPVCLIGYEIASTLFSNTTPLGEILTVSEQNRSYSCRVIGVMARTSTRSQWRKPNLEVYLPYTYFQSVSKESWSKRIQDTIIELAAGSEVEKTGKSIRAFFERKYGESGRFRMDADSILIEQMKRFLNIFSGFLIAVALISLFVGGIGITNMMLVSVNERFREIGLRKAMGATDGSIRFQFLVETILLCGFAGLVGLAIGFSAYQTLLWGASKLIPNFQFEWIYNPGAIAFSLASIFVVGVLSGLVPSIRAQRLSPIEALRSE